MAQEIEKTIIIDASLSAVWDALINPHSIRQWMADPEIGLEVITNWQPGSPIVMHGFHHLKFENKGTVLQVEPNKLLQYNYLSSISRLPDKPGNYTIIQFRLEPLENQTSLTLTANNFPDEIIFRHVDFYWRGTLNILKKFIEKKEHSSGG